MVAKAKSFETKQHNWILNLIHDCPNLKKRWYKILISVNPDRAVGVDVVNICVVKYFRKTPRQGGDYN